jgi:hypothetical protein
MRVRLRRFAICSLGLLAIAGIGYWFLIIRFDDGINPTVCGRIEKGMPLDEVVAIVGRPPGDYRHHSLKPDLDIPIRNGGVWLDRRNERIWSGQNWVLRVRLDDRGHVSDKSIREQFGRLSMKMWIESPWKTLRTWYECKPVQFGKVRIPRP